MKALTAAHLRGLAEAIRLATVEADATRLLFSIDPVRLEAIQVIRKPAAEVPLITSHGGTDVLVRLLSAFDHWGSSFMLGTFHQDGLFEFWVEPDSVA